MSTDPKARAWVEVRADALRANYAFLRERAGPEAGLIPMVKADGYGVGMAQVVAALEGESPLGYGVATVDEGVTLRDLGVRRRIMVLAPVPPTSVPDAIARGLEIAVSSVEALEEVSRASERLGVEAQVHIDVDTGMGRSGFDGSRASAWMPRVRVLATPPVRLVGCFTHLHSADEAPDTIHEQWSRFQEVLRAAPGLPGGLLVHGLNSAGLLRVPGYAAGAVRPGIFLYGGRVGADLPEPRPVVALHARVVHLRDAGAGSTLGYGATHRAAGAERWATLSIGYGDGLPRSLGNTGSVLLGGRRVPIVGRVSMDLTVVNITGVPGVGVGDVATLIGGSGREAIFLDEVAGWAGTISYEVLTGLSRRLPRVWSGPTAT